MMISPRCPRPDRARHAVRTEIADVAVVDGWALVGDAGCHNDAITGDGISDAFRDAELVAAALDRVLCAPVDECEVLLGYHAERDRMPVPSAPCRVAAHRSPTVVLVLAVGRRADRSWWGIEAFRAVPFTTIDQTCHPVVEVGAS